MSASPRIELAPCESTRAGSRARPRTSCPPASSRGTSSEPTKPLAPVTRMRICAHDDARRASSRAIPAKCGSVARDCHIQVTRFGLFAGSKSFSLRFAECAACAALRRCFDGWRPFNPTRWGAVRGEKATQGKRRSAKGQLRRMLLPLQPAVCAGPARALRDLPSQRGAAAPAAAAALRVSPGAPHARGLGVSLGAGAGRAARLSAAVGVRVAGARSALGELAARARARRAARSSWRRACR